MPMRGPDRNRQKYRDPKWLTHPIRFPAQLSPARPANTIHPIHWYVYEDRSTRMSITRIAVARHQTGGGSSCSPPVSIRRSPIFSNVLAFIAYTRVGMTSTENISITQVQELLAH